MAKKKMTRLEQETVGNMLDVAVQALQYISGSGSPVISLAGPNQAAADREPPIEVAKQCISVLRGMVGGFVTDERKTETHTLKDGETIRLSDEFDAFHHQCCKCGLVHFVDLKWQGDRNLITEWTRLEKAPSSDEIAAMGHVVDVSAAIGGGNA